jgi:large subunit ribosomal protein L15
MQLHDVHQGVKKRKLRKRIGRGVGSGQGKTAGKGHKGHKSRQGYHQNPLFEGGQMPLARRVPKRGFFNGAFKKDFAVVNVEELEAAFEAGATIDETVLRARGVVKGRHDDGVKILANGELTKPFTVHAAKFSEAAVTKITAAGGKAVVI